MLTISFKKGKVNKLIMAGHCNYDEKGKDIVCAAASILCQTMAQVLANNEKLLEREPYIEIDKGNAKIVWECKEKAKGALNNCFSTVITGLLLLCDNYPDYIQLKNG